ncbi:MAG: Ig-like domain-containing protein [Deltaproteobacteria bacterium]|nr:Ig-like domain-containing protein [Deltaproteobacteria bacterium]
MSVFSRVVCAALLFVVGCGGGPSGGGADAALDGAATDGGDAPDGAPRVDGAAEVDAALTPVDAALPAVDAAVADAAVADATVADAQVADTALADAAPDAPPATVTALRISPRHPVLGAGEVARFRAIATLSTGATVDVTADAGWLSSDTIAATVSNSGASKGEVTGGAQLPVTISAQYGAFTAMVSFEINAWGGVPMARNVGSLALDGDDRGGLMAAFTSPTTAGGVGLNGVWLKGGFMDPEETIPTGTGDVETPELVLSDRGDRLASWVRDIGDRGARYLSGNGSLFNATGWQAARSMEMGSLVLGQPVLSVSRLGTGYAVWSEGGGSGGSYAARFTPAAGWDMVPTLVGSGVGRIAATTSNGAVLVLATSAGPAQPGHVRARRYVVGTGWTAVVDVDQGDITSAWAEVAVDATGRAVAIWHHRVGTSHGLRAASMDATGTWAAAVDVVAPGPGGINFPKLAMNYAGDAVLAWQQGDAGVLSGWRARYSPSTGWSAPATFEQSTGMIRGFSVAINGDGEIYNLWSELSGTTWRLLVNHENPEIGLSEAIGLDTSTTGSFDELEIFSAVRGGAVAGYVKTRAGGQRDLNALIFD